MQDIDTEKAVLGESDYTRLRSLAAAQMDKLGKKKLIVKLGPLGEYGGEKEGKPI